jgi:hypothetical protein
MRLFDFNPNHRKEQTSGAHPAHLPRGLQRSSAIKPSLSDGEVQDVV